MLDELYSKLKQHNMAYNDSFNPADSVRGVRWMPVKNSQELTVIIPPWHASRKLLEYTAKHENKRGRSVLLYFFDDDILSSNVQRTIDSFKVIANHLEAQLAQRQYSNVHWQATSLGASVLMYALGMNKLPATTVNLVVPGGDLAQSLWTGLRTQPLRQQFESQGLTLQELQHAWHELAPTTQASYLHPTNFTIKLSQADKIILPDTSQELVHALQAADNIVNLTVNKHLGHYGTILLSAVRL